MGGAKVAEKNTLTKVAIGAVALVAVAIFGVALSSGGSTVGGPPASSTLLPTPSPSIASLPVHPTIVNGWPGARHNPAGRYSWEVRRDSWMHNPTDNGLGVSITFSASANAYESGPTTVTIAGRAGTYQELPVGANGKRTELWIVDIKDTKVTITVEARPGTTAAELAEANAIIESIHSEATGDRRRPFRLTFTLPNGWDSG